VKRGRRILLVVLGCGLAALIAWRWLHHSEPYYQGRALTAWLAIYEQEKENAPQVLEAAEAIRHIGTNALPFLLERLRQKDPPNWRKNLATALGFMPRPVDQWWFDLVLGKEERVMAATSGFEVLGAQAAPAVPELIRLLNDKDTFDIAIVELSLVGEAALPIMTETLTNRANPLRVRVGVIQAIGSIETNRCHAVEALVLCLDDEPRVARQAALWALARLGEQARDAVPRLTNALYDADPDVREAATNALLKVAPELLGRTNNAGD
jgi:hypothetical protein